MQIFTTITDYIAQVVIPALGDFVDDFDVEAIAHDMTEWHDEKDDKGNILLGYSGLVERNDVDFWDIAAQHDISGK